MSLWLYFAAIALTVAAALISGVRDLNSFLAVFPLLIPVVPLLFVLAIDSHRAEVVIVAGILFGAFVYTASFTVGKAYAPALFALLVGGLFEAAVFGVSKHRLS
ncbi:MAG: hypothetical protein ACC654_04050 [Acidimicrobiia bacterium]